MKKCQMLMEMAKNQLAKRAEMRSYLRGLDRNENRTANKTQAPKLTKLKSCGLEVQSLERPALWAGDACEGGA